MNIHQTMLEAVNNEKGIIERRAVRLLEYKLEKMIVEITKITSEKLKNKEKRITPRKIQDVFNNRNDMNIILDSLAEVVDKSNYDIIPKRKTWSVKRRKKFNDKFVSVGIKK